MCKSSLSFHTEFQGEARRLWSPRIKGHPKKKKSRAAEDAEACHCRQRPENHLNNMSPFSAAQSHWCVTDSQASTTLHLCLVEGGKWRREAQMHTTQLSVKKNTGHCSCTERERLFQHTHTHTLLHLPPKALTSPAEFICAHDGAPLLRTQIARSARMQTHLCDALMCSVKALQLHQEKLLWFCHKAGRPCLGHSTVYNKFCIIN